MLAIGGVRPIIYVGIRLDINVIVKVMKVMIITVLAVTRVMTTAGGRLS